VKKYFKGANEKQTALLMEFVLHGLSAYSVISKKVVEGKIEFSDLMGSIINLKANRGEEDDEFNEDDFN
jgi:magnesium chelatase subunit I